MHEESGYTSSRRAIVELWEEHTAHEFEDDSTEKTLATMNWDQACVLVQVEQLDADSLPVASGRKLLDPASVPSGLLIRRAEEG